MHCILLLLYKHCHIQGLFISSPHPATQNQHMELHNIHYRQNVRNTITGIEPSKSEKVLNVIYCQREDNHIFRAVDKVYVYYDLSL
jgi:hypothetical protein